MNKLGTNSGQLRLNLAGLLQQASVLAAHGHCRDSCDGRDGWAAMASTGHYQRDLLRRFDQLHVLATEPAKMGQDLLNFGFHRGTFQQGYENPEWLRTLLGMAAHADYSGNRPIPELCRVAD